MKKIYYISIIAILLTLKANAQRVLTIGGTKYTIHSPLHITSEKKNHKENHNDKNQNYDNTINNKSEKKYKQRTFNENIFGLAYAIPLDKNKELDIDYGKSYNLEIASLTIKKVCKVYAIGYGIHYSFYNYRLKTNDQDVFNLDVKTTKGRHYYRTDNLGVSLFNRLYLNNSLNIYLEYGAWGNFSYSKRVKIKTWESGHKEKYKYRDSDKFNALQAGVQAGVNLKSIYIFGKYQFTNTFNPSINVNEPTKLMVGVQLRGIFD